MNQYLIDLQFINPDLSDEDVTDRFGVDALFGKNRSWADWVDIKPWPSIEVRTPLNLDELRAKLNGVLNCYTEAGDPQVTVTDIWMTGDGDQPWRLDISRYQVSFDVEEELQEELNPQDADAYWKIGMLGSAFHNDAVQSFASGTLDWATNVSTNGWGVSIFTSGLSLKELQERFNTLLPPYIKIWGLWRAVPRNYI